MATESHERNLSLFAATGVGVGAIVGGGILALTGVAFHVTGPAAILAFAFNGLIAFLTALSFAEMSSKFPESGGTYTFSRKVLSVESAFTVGWVVWFASIVAAVLYAIGFGTFAVIFAKDLFDLFGYQLPEQMTGQRAATVVALVTTIFLGISLMLTSAGGGTWTNVGKVVVFLVLIVGGLWALLRQPLETTSEALDPFFTAGAGGLLQAMGYSFIALQGFDLIAAVGGEVKNPTKNIPRAMIYSLGIALAIYIPLLFVIATVGTAEGQTISMLAAQDTEGIVAAAAKNFLGPAGYWLVIVAAVLSMFTALQANLYASSRIAMAMSRDHTLPASLSKLSKNRNTPNHSIIVTTALVLLLLVLLPDVAQAGAAASLIFLITFAISHWLSVLVRQRSGHSLPPFRVPFYPFVPIVGGVACLALALFQGIAVPAAGTIAVIWLTIGGVMFMSLFAKRARLRDISNVAANPELVRLRGSSPLVLVPIANPQNAHAMITLAETMVPAEVGRVLLQSIVVAPDDWNPDEDQGPVERSQEVVREVLKASTHLGVRVETLTTVAPSPMEEIERVAELHRCKSVVLGLSEISEQEQESALEGLVGRLDTDVVVFRAPEKWQLTDTKKILVPVGGLGGHDYLLARLLGSLSRKQQREVTFLRVAPKDVQISELNSITKSLDRMAHDNGGADCERVVLQSDDPVATIAERAKECDLMILGIQRIGPKQKFFGSFIVQLAERTTCPIIVMSRRG